MSLDDPRLVLDLDPEQARLRRAGREDVFHRWTVPALRMLGLLFLGLVAHLHHRYIEPVRAVPALTLLLLAYGFGSWAVLLRSYRSRRSLGLLFLNLDVPVWACVVYSCGAERSWLSWVLLARVADQTNTNFRRVLWFAHWTLLVYLTMVMLAQVIGHHPVDWAAQGVKAFLFYAFSIYISLTARTAQKLRRRTSLAVQTARDLILEQDRNNRVLAEARQRAEAAAQARSQFLSVVGHELRTPLNGILGFSELLGREKVGELNERQKQYVENIRVSGKRLLNMVTAVLDVADLSSGRFELQEGVCDLPTVVRLAGASLSKEAEVREVRLEWMLPPEPGHLRADPKRLEQVFFQLLDNAVKFSPRGGQVRIEGQRSGDVFEVRVTDSGPGIDPAHHERIFRDLERLDSTLQRGSEGAGVGLSLARRLVRLHGGDIHVHSQPGQGASFLVRLPIR